MGLIPSGDEYYRRTDAALMGFSRLDKVDDDMCHHSDDLTTLVHDLWALFTVCRENNITLSPDKRQLIADRVNFAGYILSADGVSADPAKIEAIARFLRPTNITQLRSFMGLVVKLSDFSVDIAGRANPLRLLLRSGGQYVWNDDHEQAFESVEQTLSAPPILSTFDPAAETMLLNNASRKNGLGYLLLQRQDSLWKLILCGSHFKLETEVRYAMVELELHAVEWATKKCRLYLLGLPSFTLVVDHQPLVTILDRYNLDAVEKPRLQRMKTCTPVAVYIQDCMA